MSLKISTDARTNLNVTRVVMI